VGVFWFLTLGAAVFEIVVGAAAMSGTRKAGARSAAILGLIGAVLCGNLAGLVLEIIALVNLGKPEVENWLAASNTAAVPGSESA
jgi:hypothetical protein